MTGSVSKIRAPGKRKAAARTYHPGRLIDCEDALVQGAAELARLDPEIVGRLVEIGGPPPLRRRELGFAGLAAIIVSQQVSVASAAAIYARLEAAITPLEAAGVATATDEMFRACGLSTPKVKALRALAVAVNSGALDIAALAAMDASDAHVRLVEVNGIGPWTADIFLLFCLGHPDAFPAGDIALQEAARIVLGLEARPDADALETIAERWRPYRGIAARMLWAFYRAVKQRSGLALTDAAEG